MLICSSSTTAEDGKKASGANVLAGMHHIYLKASAKAEPRSNCQRGGNDGSEKSR